MSKIQSKMQLGRRMLLAGGIAHMLLMVSAVLTIADVVVLFDLGVTGFNLFALLGVLAFGAFLAFSGVLLVSISSMDRKSRSGILGMAGSIFGLIVGVSGISSVLLQYYSVPWLGYPLLSLFYTHIFFVNAVSGVLICLLLISCMLSLGLVGGSLLTNHSYLTNRLLRIIGGLFYVSAGVVVCGILLIVLTGIFLYDISSFWITHVVSIVVALAGTLGAACCFTSNDLVVLERGRKE